MNTSFAHNHAACRSIAHLHEVDSRVGELDTLFVPCLTTLSHQAAHHIKDADGLTFGSTNDNAVVDTVYNDVVNISIIDTGNSVGGEDGHIGNMRCRHHKGIDGLCGNHLTRRLVSPGDEVVALIGSSRNGNLIACIVVALACDRTASIGIAQRVSN